MEILKQIPIIGLFFHLIDCQQKSVNSDGQSELLTQNSRLSKTGRKTGEIGKEDPLSALGTAIPGVPGEDYPIYSQPPETSFSCSGQVNGGYYADPEAQCQTFHICAREESFELTKFSFLCPNGTLFQQQYFVCDWWFNVDCSKTEDFYFLNDELQAAREAATLAAAIRRSGDLASTQKVTDGNTQRQNNQETKPAAKFQKVSRVQPTTLKSNSQGISNRRRGSGLRKSSSSSSLSENNSLPGSSSNFGSKPVKNPGDIEFPTDALPAVETPTEKSYQAETSTAPVQTLYGAPVESVRPDVEEVFRFEAEIPPEFSRTSRDIDFGYRNFAKVVQSNPSPQELLERLVQIVDANAI